MKIKSSYCKVIAPDPPNYSDVTAARPHGAESFMILNIINN